MSTPILEIYHPMIVSHPKGDTYSKQFSYRIRSSNGKIISSPADTYHRKLTMLRIVAKLHRAVYNSMGTFRGYDAHGKMSTIFKIRDLTRNPVVDWGTIAEEKKAREINEAKTKKPKCRRSAPYIEKFLRELAAKKLVRVKEIKARGTKFLHELAATRGTKTSRFSGKKPNKTNGVDARRRRR